MALVSPLLLDVYSTAADGDDVLEGNAGSDYLDGIAARVTGQYS